MLSAFAADQPWTAELDDGPLLFFNRCLDAECSLGLFNHKSLEQTEADDKSASLSITVQMSHSEEENNGAEPGHSSWLQPH